MKQSGMIKLSDETLIVLRQNMMEVDDMLIALLLYTGHDQWEAYSIIKQPSTVSKESLKVQASAYIGRRKGIKAYVETLTNVYGGNKQHIDISKIRRKKKGDDKSGVYSKEDALTSVNNLIVAGNLSDKEKLQAIDLLNKLQQWNKETNKDDEQLIHFYMPIQCKRCNLYIEERKKKEEEAGK